MSMPVDLQLPRQVVEERVEAVVDLERFNLCKGDIQKVKKILIFVHYFTSTTCPIVRSNVRDDP